MRSWFAFTNEQCILLPTSLKPYRGLEARERNPVSSSKIKYDKLPTYKLINYRLTNSFKVCFMRRCKQNIVCVCFDQRNVFNVYNLNYKCNIVDLKHFRAIYAKSLKENRKNLLLECSVWKYIIVLYHRGLSIGPRTGGVTIVIC